MITLDSYFYHLTITDEHIIIGCQCHTKEKWKSFTEKDIVRMDGEQSAETWFKYREFILMLAEEGNAS